MPVLCACSWTGELTGRASCPSCGRAYTDRIDRGRLDALRLIAIMPTGYVEPQRRKRMIAIGVLAVELRVTEQGHTVLDAAARRDDGVRMPGTARSDADRRANASGGYMAGDGPSEDRLCSYTRAR